MVWKLTDSGGRIATERKDGIRNTGVLFGSRRRALPCGLLLNIKRQYMAVAQAAFHPPDGEFKVGRQFQYLQDVA